MKEKKDRVDDALMQPVPLSGRYIPAVV